MCRGPFLMTPLSLIQYETNSFSFFKFRIKGFVEELLNFTDYCVTLLEIGSQYFYSGLEKTKAKFYRIYPQHRTVAYRTVP